MSEISPIVSNRRETRTLLVDRRRPANDPARYDQEVLLAAHHWQGSWISMQDIRKGPPPDNGLDRAFCG